MNISQSYLPYEVKCYQIYTKYEIVYYKIMFSKIVGIFGRVICVAIHYDKIIISHILRNEFVGTHSQGHLRFKTAILLCT